jgi:peptidoglycan/xylan/chitin deacetylase (PgdA/CDA1 family)
VKKALLKTFYRLGGFAPFQWASRGKILILMYHRFGETKHPDKISRNEFEAHLKYLGKHKRVLPLAEAAELFTNGKPLPQNAAIITIDDGYADTYEVAFPLLKKYNFPATLFAVTNFLDGKIWLWTDKLRYVLQTTKSDSLRVEFENRQAFAGNLTDQQRRLNVANRLNSILKTLPNEEKDRKIEEIAKILSVEIPPIPSEDYAALNWAQAREMDAGNLRVESHTVTHPILTNIAPTELDFELQNSREKLENVLDRNVEIFCYPNGSYDETVRRAVRNAGYKCAVTTIYGFNDKFDNRLLLNRIAAQPNLTDFAQSVSGFEAVKFKILDIK